MFPTRIPEHKRWIGILLVLVLAGCSERFGGSHPQPGGEDRGIWIVPGPGAPDAGAGAPGVDARVELCGNGRVDPGELCDGQTIDCTQLGDGAGWSGGLASCLASCAGYDTSGCLSAAQPLDLPALSATYRSYSEIEGVIEQWAQLNSAMLQVGSYGSDQSYDNVYLKIAAPAAGAGARPLLLVESCVHGDEWIATAALLGAFHRLLGSYGKDPQITALLDSREIYFVPVVSPRSYDQQSRIIDGVDPNRSYPSPGDPNNQPQRSVANLMQLFLDVGFEGVLTAHAFGRVIMIPWGYSAQTLDDEGPDDARHRTLGQALSTVTGYQWGSIIEIMGQVIGGSSIDWYYWQGKQHGFNTVAIGLEVGTVKKPPASQIPLEVDQIYPLLVKFLEQAPASGGYAQRPLPPLPRYPQPLLQQE